MYFILHHNDAIPRTEYSLMENRSPRPRPYSLVTTGRDGGGRSLLPTR